MPHIAKVRQLDRIDLAILDCLQKDARISNVNLAKQVNLSPSPCLDRVKKLETEGYIERYGAKLNASKLKFGMSAFIQITLDSTTSKVFKQFDNAINEIKEVAECHMVAGGFDYLVKIRIVDLPGVSKNHTYVVIESIKDDLGLPIGI